MTYHRHTREFTPLAETACIINGDTPERYLYCAICKCVPTALVAPDPEPGMAYDSAGNPYQPMKTWIDYGET